MQINEQIWRITEDPDERRELNQAYMRLGEKLKVAANYMLYGVEYYPQAKRLYLQAMGQKRILDSAGIVIHSELLLQQYEIVAGGLERAGFLQ